MISLVGASGGRRSGTGSPESRITTKTTVETSQREIRARKNRWPRNGKRPRMGEAPSPLPLPRWGEGGIGAGLRAAELEVEAADLELLVWIRRPLHVLLQPVVLIGLDHRQPREVLEEDLGHLLVGSRAKLLVHREAGRVAHLVEAGLAPVVLRPAGAQQPPHHAVGIAERGGWIRPEDALEALLAVLLGAHRVLDYLDLDIDPDVLPHALDSLGHLFVVGDIGHRGLDVDLLVLVPGFLEPLARLLGVVGQRRQRGIEVIVALGNGAAGHDAAAAPELLDDGLAVDGEGERLLDERIVERRPL